MADYDSSLPVRTENDGDIGARIVDSTNTYVWSIDANGIGQVNINDGSNALVINADGSLLTQLTDGTNALVINANGGITTVMTDGTDTVAIDASGNLSTLITDGTDVLAVNADGSINVIMQETVSGGEVHAYDTLSALAPNTPTDVVTYTVTGGKTLRLMAVQGAASGAFKCEVFAGVTAGTPPTATPVAVFFGSTAGGSIEHTFPQPIEIAAGLDVVLKFTNRDKQNMDVYGFINGNEV